MKNVVYICGPTSGGKTALSMNLAKFLPNAVFINADTMQLYKGLELLSAMPSEKDLSQVEHRLFRVLNRPEPCTRRQWLLMALGEIEKALQEGKMPILVGGSRSLAAELARAAYGITLVVNNNNAPCFPDDLAAPLLFPYNLRIIILMPALAYLEQDIIQHVQIRSDASLESVAEILNDKFDEGNIYPLGTQQYLKVLKGEMTREEAHQVLIQKTLSYAYEQIEIFNELERQIVLKGYSKPLRLNALDKDAITKSLSYIKQ